MPRRKKTEDDNGPFRIKVKVRDKVGPTTLIPGRVYKVDKAVKDALGDNAVVEANG